MTDDAALVARILTGDQRAFAQLVDRYHGEAYHLALRYVRQREDAEDLVQEAFLRAYRALASYDPTRPFGAWLYAITARLCIDFHRRRKIRPISLTRPEAGTAAEEREWEIPDTAEGPEARTERLEDAARLSVLVDRLSPDYRLAILLRHTYDLSYEEISVATGVPLGTVKARIHRARNQLRAWIERMDEAEPAAPVPVDEGAIGVPDPRQPGVGTPGPEPLGRPPPEAGAEQGKMRLLRGMHPGAALFRKRKR